MRDEEELAPGVGTTHVDPVILEEPAIELRGSSRYSFRSASDRFT